MSGLWVHAARGVNDEIDIESVNVSTGDENGFLRQAVWWICCVNIFMTSSMGFFNRPEKICSGFISVFAAEFKVLDV